MPLAFRGGAKFQKAIDIILKHVIRRLVSVYMDDVIITSPSFNKHLDHLNQGSQSIVSLYLKMPGMGKPPTEGRKHDMTGQYNKARETRTTTSGTNRAVLRGDQSGLNKRHSSETLSILPAAV
ncbi:hypothetical protein TNCV_4752851 [Trichonephila clavipes]|nr:hypothetical protein TNCV_4752851 [Trichonephila clavipes]